MKRLREWVALRIAPWLGSPKMTIEPSSEGRIVIPVSGLWQFGSELPRRFMRGDTVTILEFDIEDMT